MFKSIALVTLLAIAAHSNSALIYSNFGPSNAYNTQVGHIILQDSETYFPQGESFTSLATGQVQSLDMAMGHVSGNTAVSMGLFYDVGGTIFGQNGSLVSVTTQANSFPNQSGYLSVNVASAGWTVTAGITYWLVPFPVPNSNHGWNWNSTGAMCNHYYGGNYNASVTQGVFRLATVPEPGTLAGLVMGAAVLARMRNQRKL